MKKAMIDPMFYSTDNPFQVPKLNGLHVILQNGSLVVVDGKKRLQAALTQNSAICLHVDGVGLCKLTKSDDGGITGDFTGDGKIPLKDINPRLVN